MIAVMPRRARSSPSRSRTRCEVAESTAPVGSSASSRGGSLASARAIANEPRLLLADEPTGAVDSVTSQRVLDLIWELRARRGMTAIIVSYDPQVGARADRMVTVVDGVLNLPAPDLSAASSA